MMCVIELGLAALGVYVLAVPVVRFGERIIIRPNTIFAGILLLIQLPVAALSLVAVGAAEASKASSVGDHPPSPRTLPKKYGWLEPAIVGSASLLAGALLYAGLRRDLPAYVPPDSIHGVRDFVAEEQNRHDAEQDAAAEWRGSPDPSAFDRRFRH
jgi:hypothetical protein